MNINIHVNCDNDDFVNREGTEAARILIALADRLKHYDHLTDLDILLKDTNGNSVGQCKIREDEVQSC